MAADATSEREATSERAQRRDRLNRALFWLAALVLAAGVTTFLVVSFRDTTPKGPLPPDPNAAPKAEPKPVRIDPAAQKVAGRFILTAVARRNLAASWNLMHPNMRAGYTKKEWVTSDELPIVPVPWVRNLDEARFRVDYATKRMLQLDVALIPRKGSGVNRAEIFKIGLVKVGQGKNQRWVVDYWMPNWEAAVRADPR